MGIQETWKAMSDPTRREILRLLRDKPLTAGEIGEHFPATGATISHHLAILKQAGLISDTKQGKYIFYELNLSVLEEMMSWMTCPNEQVPFPAVLYPKLPEMVPVHWDLDGGVTYGEKIKLFPLAGLSLVFGIFMPFLAKIDPRKQNYERFADAYFGTRIILLVFMIVMMSITLTESLYPGFLQVGRVVCAMVAVMFILLGNLMPKFKSNFFTGMKTPWALSNENVWNKTQRLGGRLFFFGGLVILISCFMVPEKQLFWGTMGIMLLICLIPTVMSYLWYQQEAHGEEK